MRNVTAFLFIIKSICLNVWFFVVLVFCMGGGLYMRYEQWVET